MNPLASSLKVSKGRSNGRREYILTVHDVRAAGFCGVGADVSWDGSSWIAAPRNGWKAGGLQPVNGGSLREVSERFSVAAAAMVEP